ncbi:MFS transporter [Phytoactinopolyspora limicola]|uniref:MFS transporter n=1 Tax=Phytoactinopolyspora limicola TaxID=2715536 RepID=UPI00140D4505|nr:MFS transporter [Phytoactinopolyspora limicola]
MKPLHPSVGLPPSYIGTALLGRTAEEGAPIVIVLLALDRTGQAWLGGLLVAAMTVPHVVTGPLGGHLRDRTGRPVAVTVAAAFVVAAALAGLASSVGHLSWPFTVLIALAGGSAGPLLLGGLSSFIGGLVSPDQRPGAHAVDAATYNVAGIAGPGLGALLAALASPAAAAYTLAAVAALAALCATSLPPDGRTHHLRPRTPSGGSEVAPGLLAGFTTIWRIPILRATTVVTTLAHAGLGGLAVTAPLLAVHLGAAESTGGLFLSAVAAGATLGSLAMTHRRARTLPAMPVILTSLAVIAGSLGLAALTPSIAVAAVCFALAGFADGPLLTVTLHVRTATSPPVARTQVFMVGASLKLTASAAGAAAAGFAAVHGAPVLLAAMAAIVAGSVIVAGFLPSTSGSTPPRRGTS